MPQTLPLRALCACVAITVLAAPAGAQWTNRYPKLGGYSHHVYVEGYELPILNAGITDPAAVPGTGDWLVASRGWLWRFDAATGTGTRLTSGAGMDSRPAWSPDGRRIAFTRDDGATLSVVVLDVASGAERVLERGFAMDPAFSADGGAVFYSSGSAGDLDIWRFDLATGERTRITTAVGLERRPLPHPDGRRLVYIAKPRGGADAVRVRELGDGAEVTLASGSLWSQLATALSPDGSLVAYTAPGDDTWELRLASVDRPGATVLLRSGAAARPLAPAFSSDGAAVVFVEADSAQRFHLHRVPVAGGPAAAVPARAWEWGAATGRLRVRTAAAGGRSTPARLTVMTGDGHPLVPDEGQPRFDGQNGTVFFYSDGAVDLTVPAGEIVVTAVHGLSTPPVTRRIRIAANEQRTLDLELASLWDARAAGWYSGDHHFHLNYGGQYALRPADLVPLLRGEDLDVATPLIANLHNRFEEQHFWNWRGRTPDALPAIVFGQEVRPHFLGHTALIGADSLFWPWVWGPGYEVYGRDDRPNAVPLRFGRTHGALGVYVHPVSRRSPFDNDTTLAAIPVNLVVDAVLGQLDALEVVCLWSDELGTSDLWHRLLNLGIPIAPTAGTDVMTDFYRTMAVGTTRAYVHLSEGYSFERYLDGLRAGHSVVTNGPMLDFRLADKLPGEVHEGRGRARWTLDLRSAVPVERIEILVNGRVVWSGAGVDSAGAVTRSGTLNLPAGGWVAARAVGPETHRWPAMDSYAFAHTGPVWLGRRGSTDPAASRAAAADLLRALSVAERRLEAGYAGADIPRLRAQFAAARDTLTARARR